LLKIAVISPVQPGADAEQKSLSEVVTLPRSLVTVTR